MRGPTHVTMEWTDVKDRLKRVTGQVTEYNLGPIDMTLEPEYRVVVSGDDHLFVSMPTSTTHYVPHK